MKFSIKFLFLFFLALSCKVEAQVFQSKGSVFNGGVPLPGISILINHKHSGNTDVNGLFEVTANLGDTLTLSNVFYKDFKLVLKDTLYQKIELQAKEFSLNEVTVSFNKRELIDSLLLNAFFKLNRNPIKAQAFLRQSVTEDNLKTVLLNEGVLNFVTPFADALSIKDASKEININVEQSCNLILEKKGKIIYDSNPQIKIRMGLVPGYFCKQFKPDIKQESIKSDSVNTFININGSSLIDRVFLSYTFVLDKRTGNLKHFTYYCEAKKADIFFTEFNYESNELTSLLASAKQVRLGKYYSTNDEIFIFPKQNMASKVWNFNPNKCGLEKYINSEINCTDLGNFKKKNKIPERSYY